MSGVPNLFDHITNSVALVEPVLVRRRIGLEILHDEPLEPLHLLVRRTRHLQQCGRHDFFCAELLRDKGF